MYIFPCSLSLLSSTIVAYSSSRRSQSLLASRCKQDDSQQPSLHPHLHLTQPVCIPTHCAPFLHHFPAETAAAWCPTRRRPLLHLRRATSTSAAAAATARARGTDTGRRGTRSGRSSSSSRALPLSTHFWVSVEGPERANMDGTGGCEAGIRDRRHILREEWTMRRFVMLPAPHVYYASPIHTTVPADVHVAYRRSCGSITSNARLKL